MDLMKAYEKMSFQARNLGQAASLLARMHQNPDTLVVMTLAGALVPGGLQGTICDAVENHLVDVIISTGANMSHDIVEGTGHHHYRTADLQTDTELKAAFINRIYDTFLDDDDFLETAAIIKTHLPQFKGTSSCDFTRFLGSIAQNRCILKSAYEHNVPIFIPALNDSELGLVLNYYNFKQDDANRIVWNGLQDNIRFAEIIKNVKSSGLLICGGGVPKNWAQQVTPLLEYLHLSPGDRVRKFDGYKYGITITTDTPVYGGLSGCTFSESTSWGKYSDQADYITVNCDTTIALPLIIGAVLEGLRK